MKKDYIESCGTCAEHPITQCGEPGPWCMGRDCSESCILQSMRSPSGITPRFQAVREPELIQFLKIEV